MRTARTITMAALAAFAAAGVTACDALPLVGAGNSSPGAVVVEVEAASDAASAARMRTEGSGAIAVCTKKLRPGPQ